MVVIRVNNRRAAVWIWQDTQPAQHRQKLPGLGVVAIGGQRGKAGQVGQVGRFRQGRAQRCHRLTVGRCAL